MQYDLSMTLDETRNGATNSEFNLYREFASVYRQLELPDLMQVPSENMDELNEQTRQLDRRLRQWLKKESVDLNEFQNLEELKRWLQS